MDLVLPGTECHTARTSRTRAQRLLLQSDGRGRVVTNRTEFRCQLMIALINFAIHKKKARRHVSREHR